MPGGKGREPEVRLTEAELELMNILWDRGGGTVRDVLAVLGRERKVAYTTVSTILRILEQKGLVRSTKHGQSHQYTPVITRAVHESAALKRLVAGVFHNTPGALVARLIDDRVLSDADLLELRRLLDERLPP